MGETTTRGEINTSELVAFPLADTDMCIGRAELKAGAGAGKEQEAGAGGRTQMTEIQ